MKKYRCTVCDYIYDPAVGDPDSGIAPGTAFEDLPDDWSCVMRSRACEKGRSFHSGLRFLFRQPVPFEGEQELFARQTAGVTG